MGWGRRWEEVRDAHAKAQVLGGGCWVGDGGAWDGIFFFFRCSNKGENARRRPGPSAQDPRKMETLWWVCWCRTMVQNHHRGGRDGWWVVLVGYMWWGEDQVVTWAFDLQNYWWLFIEREKNSSNPILFKEADFLPCRFWTTRISHQNQPTK